MLDFVQMSVSLAKQVGDAVHFAGPQDGVILKLCKNSAFLHEK